MPALMSRIQECAETSNVRKELEQAGYVVEFWSVGPKAEVMGIRVLEESLFYLEEGEAALTVNDTFVSVQAKERIVIPAGASFGVVNSGTGSLSWLYASRKVGTSRIGVAPGLRRIARLRRRRSR